MQLRLFIRPLVLAAFAFQIVSAPLTAHAATISGSVTLAPGGAENGDLSRVVVYLDSDPALASPIPPNAPRPQIVQRNKAFNPDLLVVVQGTTVEFPNWDPYSHNVFSRSAAASFDLERYPQGQSKSYTFNTAGVVQIFCNIHPQMRAVLLVVPNRFFVRTDSQGRFVLKDVPPGRYTLVGWDARGGEQRLPIAVGPEGVRDVTLALAANAAAPRAQAEPAVEQAGPPGVGRGLGVKRERLGLPVVGDTHPAPPPPQSH